MRRHSIIPLLLLMSVGLRVVAQQQIGAKGKDIYESKCVRCHGKDGTRGMFGAKNLQKSTLNDDALYTMVREGRRIMPAWKEKLTPEQIQLVMSYVKNLRTISNQ